MRAVPPLSLTPFPFIWRITIGEDMTQETMNLPPSSRQDHREANSVYFETLFVQILADIYLHESGEESIVQGNPISFAGGSRLET
jgi:hypothetical protein